MTRKGCANSATFSSKTRTLPNQSTLSPNNFYDITESVLCEVSLLLLVDKTLADSAPSEGETCGAGSVMVVAEAVLTGGCLLRPLAAEATVLGDPWSGQ